MLPEKAKPGWRSIFAVPIAPRALRSLAWCIVNFQLFFCSFVSTLQIPSNKYTTSDKEGSHIEQ